MIRLARPRTPPPSSERSLIFFVFCDISEVKLLPSGGGLYREKSGTMEISLCACGAERCAVYAALHTGSRRSCVGGAGGCWGVLVGVSCVLEVVEIVLEVMRCVLLCMLEAVEFEFHCGSFLVTVRHHHRSCGVRSRGVGM